MFPRRGLFEVTDFMPFAFGDLTYEGEYFFSFKFVHTVIINRIYQKVKFFCPFPDKEYAEPRGGIGDIYHGDFERKRKAVCYN